MGPSRLAASAAGNRDGLPQGPLEGFVLFTGVCHG